MERCFPPLSLYIHFPWCVRKCPYCDFNSHGLKSQLDEAGYIDALLADLDGELDETESRPLQSIFMGGGTPSLFSPAAIARLLKGVGERLGSLEGLEITMEANPGTLETGHFAGYRDAGVNRLSIGVQSFTADCLEALGRIHDPDEAYRAAQRAKRAGFERINLDLMFGLPRQTLDSARQDITTALELDPGHISYYQLTLEPNTAFQHAPPVLPDEESTWRIQEQGQGYLAAAGYAQYEISAYARPGHSCRHNLNYWTYGDYLGIGAGAHGKLTLDIGEIRRTSKWRHPRDYLANIALGRSHQSTWYPDASERPLEFMMNWLRLHEGFTRHQFEERTGVAYDAVAPTLRKAEALGLMTENAASMASTDIGRQYLNNLLALFTPD